MPKNIKNFTEMHKTQLKEALEELLKRADEIGQISMFLQ